MRLYEREKVEVLGPGSVILEDSQLSLRILGYVNHQTARKSIQHKLRSGDAAHRTHTLSPRLFSPESNEIPKARSFDVIFWVATLAQNSTRDVAPDPEK